MTSMTLHRWAGMAGALVAAAVIILAGPASADNADSARQVGTYDYLATPDYDGLRPVSDAASGMTLGLGTFDRLDGELVLVGGTVYRVGVDGVPREADGRLTTPFFQGVSFVPTRSGPVAPGTTCAALASDVTRMAGGSTGMVAVRVRGTFTDLVMRSVAAQPVPYPTLAAAVAGQTVFPLGQRRAVLVGFFTGADFSGVGAPGLHLHGVTADRSAGGHVLSCVVGSDVQLSVQPLDRVTLLGAAQPASAELSRSRIMRAEATSR
jgi:acetolactate decarboxylase